MHKSYIPKFAYKLAAAIAVVGLSTAALTGCASATDSSTPSASPLPELTLVTHDSFSMSKEQLAQFKTQTGITVNIVKAGDAGALTNKLVLTKDTPIGDAFFGIDNTFSGVALQNKIVSGRLTAIDYGDVCMNYDKAWFKAKGISAPTSIDQLVEPTYKNLTVVENPSTSSTGLAFLAATVAKYGNDGWQDYWTKLKANGVKVTAGWEDAYYTDFSGSTGKGKYPVVLSYASSPAYEIRKDGTSGTASILDGCFRQVEYAGVLAGAKNPVGAQLLIKFLLSDAFQRGIPESMYVYPIVKSTELPADWSKWATVATAPLGAGLDINANRESWLTAWSDIFG
ncbi:MAG: thiamine ABC transporter substrate-binding protein [Actinomycetales bacterium]|nr:thiamine ABC transporter substrate-binding protein [Actinomycetales bacterium]